MKKLLVICGAGMTSSILVSRMREYAAQRGDLDYKIGSCAVNQIEQYCPQADILFTAPHLSYLSDDLKKKYPDKQVYEISRKLYGGLDGAGVIALIREHQSVKKKTVMNRIVNKIGGSRHLRSISQSFYSLMPVLIIGSVFTMVQNFPYPPYLELIEGTVFHSVLSAVIFCTTGCVSLYMAFLIAYHYGHIRGVPGRYAGLNAMVCFLLLQNYSNGTVDTSYFGMTGMFTAIITAFFSVEIFTWLRSVCDRFGEKIKALPRAIYLSFLSLIPGFCSVLVFIAIAALFMKTSYGTYPNFIYRFLQKRISSWFSGNIASVLIAQAVTHLLWFVGIHGGQVVGAVMNPLLAPLAVENVTAYANHTALPNIIHSQFPRLSIYGGAGSTLSLVVLMVFFAKSRHMKQIGTVALPMGIFFINEPVVLGLPIMMNFLFLAPFVCIPAVSVLLTYLLMKAGILPYAAGFEMPWTTPMIVTGLIQGGWRIALWQIILFGLQMAAWFPFFKVQDQRYYEEELSESLPSDVAENRMS